MTLELPKLLDLPAKLLRIIDKFNPYRYFLIEGGRGGGKSQGIARIILYLCEHYHLRVVCGREIQKSIDESVYTIFKDLIFVNKLNYEVLADRITHRTTQSTIRFKGFREQGSVNIKGLEGVDICWIDEAQSISKNTLDIIIPTIRKEKAKIFFTMNRHLKNDPVFSQFIGREDCLHININYTDNPFCSNAMKHEAIECQTKDPDGYRHIWLGEPLEEADNYLFPETKIEECKTIDYTGCGYHDVVMGVDIARYGGDYSVATILQRRGPVKFEVKHVERWAKKDLMETTGRIIDLASRFKPKAIAVDADGLGAGVVDRMRELDINVTEFRGGMVDEINNKKLYANLRTEWYCKLQELIDIGYLGCAVERTLINLRDIQYTHKSNGQKIILSKEAMKSKGVPSPDDADSLMMAYYATSHVDKPIEENEDFRSPILKQHQPENLFRIAGFR